MGAPSPRPVVLDAAALIAFDRNDRAVRRMVELAFEHGRALHVPAGVVAQAWRDGARQVRLGRLLRAEALVVHPLDMLAAKAAGVLCGASDTADVVDASVVLVARHLGAVVVSSDAVDLHRIDPKLVVERC